MSDLPSIKAMLQELVAIPSVSSTRSNLDMSNRRIIELLADWCERIGMSVELVCVDAVRDKWNLMATMYPRNGVVDEEALQGTGLTLSGHSDTVPYDEGKWDTDPFTVTEANGRWYGLGVCDMKVFFPLALQAIADCREMLTQPVRLLATADEESAMLGARHFQQQGQRPGQYVIIGEPTGLRPIHQHKGIMMEQIHIQGVTGHSSQPALGKNALDAMLEVAQQLQVLREGWRSRYQNAGFEVPSPTLNLGCIHGGDNPNRICKECRLQFDVRLLPGMPIREVRESIVQQLTPIAERRQVDIELTPLFEGVESFMEKADAPLIQLCESLTGRSAGSVAFATEAPFFQMLGAQTVVLGPGDIEQAHQPDEYLELSRVEPMLEILGRAITELCCRANPS